MITSQQKSLIAETNAKYLGISGTDLMEKAGERIAEEVIKKYGKDISIGVLCGLGQNGGEGFSIARHLINKGVDKVLVYLVGRNQDIKNEAALNHWERLKEIKNGNLIVKQDVFAETVEDHDLFLECLTGVESKSKLTKRFADIIKRIVRFKGKKVVIDSPVPGYKWDYSISLTYPKTSEAVVVNVGMPKEVDLYTGPGEVKVLEKPQKETHKTQNGKVLIIGGSDIYHGAPLMAAMAASKLVGEVYFYSTPENKTLVESMKSQLPEFITVSENELEKYMEYADVLLIGPGLEDNLLNRALVKYLLEKYPDKKKVIDAYAISMVDKDLLKGSVLTPHRGEIRHLFPGEDSFLRNTKTGGDAVEGRLRRFVKETGAYVILKGHVSLLFGPEGEFKMNKTGNAGMAKGGSGDILSGIIAALATKNDLWLSLCAGAFINGLAGDLCFQEVGYNFSATDLIPKMQQVIKWADEL